MIGIDEVGRGCWAGPLLVVAARSKAQLSTGLKDSKLLSLKQRNALYVDIISSCDVGEGWVEAREIDAFGLAAAMRLGVRRALESLGAQASEDIIFDGNVNYCPSEYTAVKAIVDADELFPVVSAASIYAKVTRDRYMQKMAKTYPAYRFDRHVGYGTRLHHDLLKRHGICTLHRISFKPIKALL